jgi:hypothetical protein
MLQATPVDSFQDSDDSPPHVGGCSEPRLSKSHSEDNADTDESKFSASNAAIPSQEIVNSEPGDLETKLPESKQRVDSNPPERGSPSQDVDIADMPPRSASSKSNKRPAPDSDPSAEDDSPKSNKAAKTGISESRYQATEGDIKTAGRPARTGLRSLFANTSPAPTSKVSGDYKSGRRPEPKSKGSNDNPALPKNWQFPQVLTSKQSPLVKHSGLIAQILESDEAWTLLTAEQQLHLHHMLRDTDPQMCEDGKHESPMPYLMTTKHKESWQRDIETVERDIKDGRMDPKWRAKAEAAFKSRLRGDLLDDAQKAAKRRKEEREGGGFANAHVETDEDGQAAEESQSSQEVKRSRTNGMRKDDTQDDEGEQDEDEDDEFVLKPTSTRKSVNKSTLKSKSSSKSMQLASAKRRKGSDLPSGDGVEGQVEILPKTTPRRVLKPKPSNLTF